MKILVANPNTSAGVTDRLVASGKLVASAGTELIPMTAPRGVPYIATRAEAAIGGAVFLECWPSGAARSTPRYRGLRRSGAGRRPRAVRFPGGRHGGSCDAGGLHARPLLLDRSFSKSLEPWFAEIVAWHGLSGRCAAIRMLDEGFTSIDEVQEEKEQS